MEVSVKAVGEVKVVALGGSLDTQTSPKAEAELNRLIDAGSTRIVVDLKALDYISSAGLRILLAAAKRLRAANGELRVCNLNEVVTEVFDISGFDMILTVTPSEREALDGFTT